MDCGLLRTNALLIPRDNMDVPYLLGTYLCSRRRICMNVDVHSYTFINRGTWG